MASSGVEPGRTGRLRHPTRRPGRTQRPARRRIPGHRQPAYPRNNRFYGQVLPAHQRAARPQTSATAAPADRHRRQRRPAHTAHRHPDRQCWNFVDGSREELARKRNVIQAHCHDIARDPNQITLSSHIRRGAENDPGPAVNAAAALRQARPRLSDHPPRPHDPAVFTPARRHSHPAPLTLER